MNQERALRTWWCLLRGTRITGRIWYKNGTGLGLRPQPAKHVGPRDSMFHTTRPYVTSAAAFGAGVRPAYSSWCASLPRRSPRHVALRLGSGAGAPAICSANRVARLKIATTGPRKLAAGRRPGPRGIGHCLRREVSHRTAVVQVRDIPNPIAPRSFHGSYHAQCRNHRRISRLLYVVAPTTNADKRPNHGTRDQGAVVHSDTR